MKCEECEGLGYNIIICRAENNNYLMRVRKYCKSCNDSGKVEDESIRCGTCKHWEHQRKGNALGCCKWDGKTPMSLINPLLDNMLDTEGADCTCWEVK